MNDPDPPDPFADLLMPDAALAELRAVVDDWRHPDPPTRVLLIDPPDGTTEALLSAVMAASGDAIREVVGFDVRSVIAEALASGDKIVSDVAARLTDFNDDTEDVGFGFHHVDACSRGADSHPVDVLTHEAIDRVLSGDTAFIVATASSDIGWRGMFDVVVYPGAWAEGELEAKVTGAIAALLPVGNDVDVRVIAKVTSAPDLRRAKAHVARCVRLGQRVTTKSLARAMGVSTGDGW